VENVARNSDDCTQGCCECHPEAEHTCDYSSADAQHEMADILAEYERGDERETQRALRKMRPRWLYLVPRCPRRGRAGRAPRRRAARTAPRNSIKSTGDPPPGPREDPRLVCLRCVRRIARGLAFPEHCGRCYVRGVCAVQRPSGRVFGTIIGNVVALLCTRCGNRHRHAAPGARVGDRLHRTSHCADGGAAYVVEIIAWMPRRERRVA
jgi:hypothetical protein